MSRRTVILPRTQVSFFPDTSTIQSGPNHKDPHYWKVFSLNGVVKLVRVIIRLLNSGKPITKAILDSYFFKPGSGLWLWDRRLRNLTAISIIVYGGYNVKDVPKPLGPVYEYKDSVYEFRMTPREIMRMIRSYRKILEAKKGGINV